MDLSLKHPACMSAGRPPRSSIPIQLRSPPPPHLLLPLRFFRPATYLHLDALPRPEHFTLEVKAASPLGIVHVEQAFELLVRLLHAALAALGWRDVQDATGFVERQAGRGRRVAGLGVAGGGEFLGRRGLLVGFGEGAAEDAGAGEDDLGDDAVGLEGKEGRWPVLVLLSLMTGWRERWGCVPWLAPQKTEITNQEEQKDSVMPGCLSVVIALSNEYRYGR